MSALQIFVDTLEEIKSTKSGVSGSRIKKLTQIAVDNVNLSSQFVDKCYQNLKTTADSHKLGALYVIDSIARRYQDSAIGTIDANAPEGTFASGLYKFGLIIEDSLRTTINAASPDQKDKISKLVTIWRNSGTFSQHTLSTIQAEFFGGAPATPASAPSSAAAPALTADQLLKNLASLQGPPQSTSAPLPTGAFPPAAPPAAATLSAPPIPGFPTIPGLPDPQAAIQQLVAQMASSGQLPAWLPQGSFQQAAPQQQDYHQQQQQQQQQHGFDARQRFRDRDNGVSQEEAFRRAGNGGNGYSRRQRSRSPQRPRRDGPPPGHVIGELNTPGTAHYREVKVDLDPNLPNNSIKVLSRTMFVGGIPGYMNQEDVKAILRPYAEVQSVILNPERKHAFVKTYSRREAENVLQNFTKITSVNLRVRWGVGYGPRDCCDYTHGVSIIPIDRLTDADKRWVNTAQWGGIGPDRPLVPNLVMEEPDIEIGEGVSSKAISKKMPTDGSRNGPRSTKPGEVDFSANEQAELPSFMRNNNTANPLANLFSSGVIGGTPPPPPPSSGGSSIPAPGSQGSAAPAPAANPDALANLMAMLQQQQKNP